MDSGCEGQSRGSTEQTETKSQRLSIRGQGNRERPSHRGCQSEVKGVERNQVTEVVNQRGQRSRQRPSHGSQSRKLPKGINCMCEKRLEDKEWLKKAHSVKKMCCVSMAQFYPALRRDEIMGCEGIQLELEATVLNKIASLCSAFCLQSACPVSEPLTSEVNSSLKVDLSWTLQHVRQDAWTISAYDQQHPNYC